MNNLEMIAGDQNGTVAKMRGLVSEMLKDPGRALVAIAGPCALTTDFDTVRKEGIMLEHLALTSLFGHPIVPLHRLCPNKPRTNVGDWSGIGKTHPGQTLDIIAEQAAKHANVAMEMVTENELRLFGGATTFEWIGGRNSENRKIAELATMFDLKMPLGIKNGLDGDIFELHKRVSLLSKLRSQDHAPVVPIFRGMEKPQTVDNWAESFKRLSSLTTGRFIVDAAHGTERSHDPEGNHAKSEKGQLLALMHIHELVSQGHMCAGVMLEMSDAESPTDPHIRFLDGLNAVKSISLVTSKSLN